MHYTYYIGLCPSGTDAGPTGLALVEDTEYVAEPHSSGIPLAVRYLERFEHATHYANVALRVKQMMDSEVLANEPGVLIVRDVPLLMEELHRVGLIAVPVLIGGIGETARPKGYQASEGQLMTTVATLLETKRLAISGQLSLAQSLAEELRNFRKTGPTPGEEAYDRFRHDVPDTLALSVGLACWFRGISIAEPYMPS